MTSDSGTTMDPLDQPATKRDLLELATATKRDLLEYATKRDLLELEGRFDQKLDQFGRELQQKLSRDIADATNASIEKFRELSRQDMFDAIRIVSEENRRYVEAINEPIGARVAAIENENLPARVERLEAKVFPAKPLRRKRG